MQEPDLDVARTLLDKFAATLARTLESLTGTPAAWDISNLPKPDGLAWHEHRTDSPGASVWIGVPDETGAAMNDAIGQALGVFAESLGSRCEPGTPVPAPGENAAGGAVKIVLEGYAPLLLFVEFSPALATPAADAPEEPSSATLDLLLDLELPVSVCFGKSQVLLQDALRFAAGSLIELDRSVDDPVEVIINDFVIARGEVVVVNGNYGVRIQQIASRGDRLKSTGSLLSASGPVGAAVRAVG